MAIKTPTWASRMGAYPTERGWVVDRPKGRTEVVKSATFSPNAIAEWHGSQGTSPAPEPAPVVQTLREAPAVEHEVSDEEVDWHYGDDDDS